MKHWDQAVPAKGVDLGVWMDAQADPEITSAGPNSLVIRFACWEPHSRGNVAGPDEASYHGELRFSGVEAYRLLDGELGPYRLVCGDFANPECFFRHFVVRGHDSYVEVLASSYEFDRVPSEVDAMRWTKDQPE